MFLVLDHTNELEFGERRSKLRGWSDQMRLYLNPTKTYLWEGNYKR